MTDPILIAGIAAGVVVALFLWLYSVVLEERNRLRSELDGKRETAARVPLLEDQIASLQKRLDESENLEAALQNELTSRSVDTARLTKDLEASRSEAATLRTDLRHLEEELRSLQSHAEIVKETDRKEIAALNTRIIELQSALNTEKRRNEELSRQRRENEEKLDALQRRLGELSNTNATLEANLSAQQERNRKMQEDFDEQSRKLELRLEQIMQRNLDGKIKKFDETSMKSLENLLKPFRENLDAFRKKVEESQENSTKKFAELSKEIEQVARAGMNISKEAENLASALKSKKQMQGSWGEMILESVLEYSGLRKGVHYETQAGYRDGEGETKRPDVVIKLPQERTIVIDSKVSLVDYNDYIRAETDEERAIAAKKVVRSFRDQIDNLASKDYARYRQGTLQYVFMFVPIEGAFALAVQEDPALYEYALKKRIAIVNPSTLTVSLHTIYLYWQSEQAGSLATKLFEEAGKLYDKMAGFTDTFVRIGAQLQTVTKSYETAHKQLSEGSGNLLGRVENLKKLGARTSKSLRDRKIEFQELDLDDAEFEVLDAAPQLAEKPQDTDPET